MRCIYSFAALAMLVHRVTPKHESLSLVLTTQQGAALWLGDYNAATNLPLLRQRAIRSVLTAAGMLDVSYAKEERMVHKVINAFDLPSYKIASHFEDTFHFISTALARGNVLVHCVAGISRSPTLVIAFLMRRDGMGFQDAFDLVKNKRSIVCPNEGFQRELKAYESTIKKPLPVIDKAKQRLETVNGSECNLPDGMKRKEVSSCVGKRSYSLGPVKSLTGKLLLSVGNCTNRERRSSLESVKSQQLRLQPAGVPPRKREEERQQSKQNWSVQEGRLSIRKLSKQFLALRLNQPPLVILKK